MLVLIIVAVISTPDNLSDFPNSEIESQSVCERQEKTEMLGIIVLLTFRRIFRCLQQIGNVGVDRF